MTLSVSVVLKVLIPLAEMLAALVMLNPFRGVFAPTLSAKVTIPVPAVIVKLLAPLTVFLKLKAPPFELKVCVPVPVRVTGLLKVISLLVVILPEIMVLAALSILSLLIGFEPSTLP